MQYILKAPDNLKTEVKLPASKSIGNRALVINALAGGSYMPDNLSDCALVITSGSCAMAVCAGRAPPFTARLSLYFLVCFSITAQS